MDARTLWLAWSEHAGSVLRSAFSATARRFRNTAAGYRWRTSLSFRVVLSTLLLSTLVVSVLGMVVTNLVVNGLVSSHRAAAVAEAQAGLRTLVVAVGDARRGDENLSRDMVALVSTLSGKGSQAGLFDIVLVPPEGTLSAVSSGAAERGEVPARLASSVASDGDLHFKYASLARADGSSGPGLVVGGTAGSTLGPFQLYYLFPMDETADTAALVQRIMLTAGALMVVLLAGVSALVTHQVVMPVRDARTTAEKLAAGDLGVRMVVHGEDDLASLARSFNHMADSLQQHIGELERLSAVQRGFVSDVSHELRTPLTTVRMAADVLYAAREEYPPDLSRAAEILDAEVGRFEELLNDLLEISRHDANVAELNVELVDLADLVRRQTVAIEPLAQRQGCELRLSVPDEPLVAEVDATRCGRILRNLLGNALEHGAGEPVEIEVAGNDSAVAVVVSDHGRGLRPGESSQVFNRFYRGDTSRARTIGGTGLGLSISFEDTRLHGGWLQAWGEPGVGARFRLTVPLHVGGELTDSPLALESEQWRGESQDVSAVRVLSIPGGASR